MSLPKEVAQKSERLLRRRGQTCSAIVLAAVSKELQASSRAKAIDSYVAGYRKFPESAVEVGSAKAMAAEGFEETPSPPKCSKRAMPPSASRWIFKPRP